MNQHNRIMAVIRTPTYLKDWEELKRLRSIDDTQRTRNADVFVKRMQKKWRANPLPVPILPFGSRCYDPKSENRSDSGVEVISIPIPPYYWTEVVLLAHGREAEADRFAALNIKKRKNDRYLTLRLDLTKHRRDLFRDVRKHVNDYSEFVRRETTKNKPAKLSAWYVYDLHHIEGKPLRQITRKLFNVRVSNFKFDNFYERVKRLNDRAEKLVSEVSQTSRR
jgi:hypothetical protein